MSNVLDPCHVMKVEHMISEKEILITLSKDPHPFIVNLMTSFQDEKYIYMVLEYIIGGEFFTHLRNAGRFDSTTGSFYAAQVIMIFESLHYKDIIYRDLKPEVRIQIRFGFFYDIISTDVAIVFHSSSKSLHLELVTG